MTVLHVGPVFSVGQSALIVASLGVGAVITALISKRPKARLFVLALALATVFASGMAEVTHPRDLRPIVRSAGYAPYCEDWWYYTNALCWFEN